MPSWLPLLKFHQWCMSTPVAMDAYRAAIARVVRPGDVVLDIGAGTGILGFEACRAGASRVYAIECSDIVDLAPQFAAANGLRDRIVVRKGMSYDVEIPEKADVAIASMLDSFGISNHLLPTVIDARQRLLKPAGIVIPQAVQLSYCPVEAPDWYEATVDCWARPYLGFDFGAARALAANQGGSGKISKASLLAAPASFDEIVLADTSSANAAARGTFAIERPGVFHAIAGWFRATMAEGVVCSNSPLDTNPLPWNVALLPIEQATAVAPGDSAEVAVRANTVKENMIWSWDVWLRGPDGALKTEFHHTTFRGVLPKTP